VNEEIARDAAGEAIRPAGEPALRIIQGGLSPNVRPTSPETLPDVANILRRARRRRKVTLESAAEATRLPRKALAALEGSGEADDLPQAPYDRYFLREYARHLGLDERPLVALLDPPDNGDLDIATEYLAAPSPARRWPAWLLLAGSVVALVALMFFRLGSVSSRPSDHLGSDAQTVTQAPRSQPPVTNVPAPLVVHGVMAVLRLSERCWVQATIDGSVDAGKAIGPGTTIRYQAERSLELVLGNGGGVRLIVNGRSVPTGADGEVIRLSFVWEKGRLVRA
jgi:hypothetical protein